MDMNDSPSFFRLWVNREKKMKMDFYPTAFMFVSQVDLFKKKKKSKTKIRDHGINLHKW